MFVEPAAVETQPEAVTVPATAPKKRKPRAKPHKYIAVNRLDRKVGIETSFIPAFLDPLDRDDIQSLCNVQYKMLKRRMDEAKVPYNRVHTDPNCVEASTKPIQSRAKLRRILAQYYQLAEDAGLVSYNDWHRGCGAHVHVARKKGEDANSDFIATLYADLSNRPYLTWAFMMYADDNANAMPVAAKIVNESRKARLQSNVLIYETRVAEARSRVIEVGKSSASRRARELASLGLLRNRSELLQARKELAAHGDKPLDMAGVKKVVTSSNLSGKGVCVSMRPYGKHGTLEFRLFRAPGSAEAHERQVNFALAYIEYIEGLVRDKKLPAMMFAGKDTLYREWTPERAKAEFAKTLRLIGLRPSEYAEDMVNIEETFAHVTKLYPGLRGTGELVETKPKARVSEARIAENVKISRARRKLRLAQAARKRMRVKMGIPAYMHISDVVLTVGDTITFAYMYDGRIEATYTETIREQTRDGYMRDSDCNLWSVAGRVVSGGDYVLLSVDDIPVTYGREPSHMPATLEECEGAHLNKESGIPRASILLKEGDVIQYMSRRDTYTSTIIRDSGDARLPMASRGSHGYYWERNGTIDVDNVRITHINEIPVIG